MAQKRNFICYWLRYVILKYCINNCWNKIDGQLWKAAADEEIASHHTNNTWTVTPLPPGKDCIPSGWNFKFKTNKHGAPYRRKARFFAKGYRQVQGIDYQESFAPVVRYDSLRTIIAIAAERDLELIQLDVKSAFLNRIIDEETTGRNRKDMSSLAESKKYVGWTNRYTAYVKRHVFGTKLSIKP